LTLNADACRPDEVGVDSFVDEADLAEVFGRFRWTDDFVVWKPRCCDNTTEKKLLTINQLLIY